LTLEEQGGVGVAQVVQSPSRYAGSGDELVEDLAEPVRMGRAAGGAAEHVVVSVEPAFQLAFEVVAPFCESAVSPGGTDTD